MALIRANTSGGGGSVEIPFEHYYIVKGKPSSTRIVCTDADGNSFKPTLIYIRLSDNSNVSATYNGISNATQYFQTPQNALYSATSTNTIILETDGFSINSASYALTDSTTTIMAFA